MLYALTILMVVLYCLSLVSFYHGLCDILSKIVQTVNASANKQSIEVDFRASVMMVFLGLLFHGLALVILLTL